MKMIRLATVAALTTTIFAGGLNAFAEEVGFGITDNTVSFEASDAEDEDIDVEIPGGPEVPEEIDPVDPIDPEQGGNGPLRILYVPETFDFNTNTISVNDQWYDMAAEQYAANGGTSTVPYASFAQIIDTRGTHEGWVLSVNVSDFSNAAGDVLSGAALAFDGGIVEYESHLENSTPSAHDVELAAGGAAQNILSADDGQGAGRSSVYWMNDGEENPHIRLFVPGATSQSATEYNAELTWILSSTVAASGETVPGA
ncbi:WxL domain-containing protein [Enterococcus sp. RIT-PI-f]|uniref:WxL domain-containing protein n=1 Tax=Enterococcus sp. RIT-PI-f TaxID=1690244 RepID=UPI0006B899F7|nr:WxL domain-containing protein [Enterococcus sp. RIT-PI-f]KPG68523.1 hypothetical protein AEQ18_14770 [Enterococcus sp. RIT-PI-f]